MTDRSAPFKQTGRLVACLAAAGLFAFPTLAPAQTTLPPPTQYGQAGQRQDRVEELERQLREQTAENERLQYELNQAQREVARLRGMVGELADVNQQLADRPPPDPAAPATPTPAPAQPTQPRAQGTLGTLPADALPGDAGAAYTRARELLINGRYAEAEEAFRTFLAQFPDADTAADARFWFGYTLLARGNNRDAAQNFNQYLRDTPRGPRAPEAQVRLGMALVGLGHQQQGCAAFSSLTTRYPQAPRDIRDLAVREARAANCGG